jgi:hypothetical protein
MEKGNASETSVNFYQLTRRNIPEDSEHYTRYCETENEPASEMSYSLIRLSAISRHDTRSYNVTAKSFKLAVTQRSPDRLKGSEDFAGLLSTCYSNILRDFSLHATATFCGTSHFTLQHHFAGLLTICYSNILRDFSVHATATFSFVAGSVRYFDHRIVQFFFVTSALL